MKLGVAPVQTVENMIGDGRHNFLMIQLGKAINATMKPEEPENVGYGLAVSPFLIYLEEGEPSVPAVSDIRGELTNLFNNTCKAKTHLKHRSWSDSVSLGSGTDPHLAGPVYTPRGSELKLI